MAGDIPISMSRTDTKAPPLDHSIARIHRPDGSIAGGGLMVGPRTVLTCAHVIERALGADLVRAAAVALTFPLLPHQPADADKIAARVSVLFPAQLDRTGDIAVLTLETEPPAGPSPLG